jgi:hypothetical protein
MNARCAPKMNHAWLTQVAWPKSEDERKERTCSINSGGSPSNGSDVASISLRFFFLFAFFKRNDRVILFSFPPHPILHPFYKAPNIMVPPSPLWLSL